VAAALPDYRGQVIEGPVIPLCGFSPEMVMPGSTITLWMPLAQDSLVYLDRFCVSAAVLIEFSSELPRFLLGSQIARAEQNYP
jgi:hypothetical protein